MDEKSVIMNSVNDNNITIFQHGHNFSHYSSTQDIHYYSIWLNLNIVLANIFRS